MAKMKKHLFIICAAMWIACGCGGGGINLKSTGETPEGAASGSISGRVTVPASLSLSRESGGELDRSAALTSVKALPAATVSLYTMGPDGSLTAVDPVPSTTTDAAGNFTLAGVTAGVNYIIKATFAASTALITVHGVATLSTTDYGGSVAAGDIDAETTFAVEGLRTVVTTYKQGKTGADIKPLSAFSSADANNMVSAVRANLQAQVSAGNVSISSALTSSTTLTAQFTNLKNNVPDLYALVDSTSGVSDTTPPAVTSFEPSDRSTFFPTSGVFKVFFSETMKASVDLNNQATLTDSGFSITLRRVDTGGTITINANNALSYGSFSWSTTNVTNDTLYFTLKSNAALTAAGLKILYPGKTYSITNRAIPSNLKDAAGNALSTSGIATTGSFTVSRDTIAPQVSSFSPANGATNVPSNGTVFKVVFNEPMDISVNLNNKSTLSASGFYIILQRQDTGRYFYMTTTNALNYGSFSWTTTLPQDTLSFTLKSNAALTAAGLKIISANKRYNITEFSAPTNLKDYSGNTLYYTFMQLGSFTTAP